MVREVKCECNERIAVEIDSYFEFEEIRDFFEEEVKKGVYKDIPVTEPFYVGYSEIQTIRRFADKWYKCVVCGCFWEFKYPDFPSSGLVRKFPDGVYYPEQ